MEKYRRFGDEATGYNPFLKHPFLKPSGAKKLLYFVENFNQTLGPFLLIARLALLLAIGILYGILNFLGSVADVYQSSV